MLHLFELTGENDNINLNVIHEVLFVSITRIKMSIGQHLWYKFITLCPTITVRSMRQRAWTKLCLDELRITILTLLPCNITFAT